MSLFVENLKNYLVQLRDNPAGTQREPIELDPSWVRATVVQAFERLERESDVLIPPVHLKEKFNEWMAEGRGINFAGDVARRLQGSFLREGAREDVAQHVKIAIELQLGLSTQVSSLARRFEIQSFADEAWEQSNPPRDHWENLLEYALEIRAVRRAGPGFAVTPIGNVLVSLAGRDAIQWLLSVEVAQSTGPRDEWRLSRASVRVLRSKLVKAHQFPVWQIDELPCTGSTFRRLASMGLFLWILDEKRIMSAFTQFTELGESVLRFLDAPSGTPFSVLATTLSQDEAMAALNTFMEKPLPEASLHGSAQATARQARLVAHEIRNALLPAQVALGLLYENLVGSTVEAEVARFRPRIDPGISRVFKFVNDLLKTSELATRPPEPFNLVSAIQDAQAFFASTLSVRWSGPTELPPVLGFRERFVLAFVNLLRNAEQAGARHVLIDLKLEEGGQDLLMTVDDDGSGVPAQDRERIFQRGVSLRPGGTGEGLALVRDVIEFELRGKIACVEKSEGGARFRMRVPLVERSDR